MTPARYHSEPAKLSELRRRFAGEEEARRRIAREIHDDLCQRFAAAAIELKVVRRELGEDDPHRGELDAVAASLVELADDLRHLSHDLHPTLFEGRGLAEALADYFAGAERRHGLPVRLSLVDAEGAFPPDVSLGLYRIAQEAIANVIRHAGAQAIQVTLKAAGGDLSLEVADDGTGFDPAAAREVAGGLGLASIEERARLLGGRCGIDSAPGAGTRIAVTVPLPVPELHQLRRLVRRHRGVLASAALVIVTLAGGLVATAVQARRAELEVRRADAETQFLEELFKASDPRQARGTMPDARELLHRGTERVGKELRNQPLLKARLLDTLGGIHTELGLYDKARPLLDESLAIRERLNGRDSLEVAATLVRLGALAQRSGKGDAVALFQRALAIREARLGPAHAEVAEVLGKLGMTQASKGRFDEAEATLRRALALNEQLWGDRDPRVAKILHNLGGIEYYRGRTPEAERFLQRALGIREATLPPDDLDLAGSREALALLRQRQGRAAEAAPLLERLVATSEKVYGPTHPEFARTLFNLGLARKALGEDSAARHLIERALAIDERALTPAHPQLVQTLAALADLHFERRRYAEAEPLFLRLLKLRATGATYTLWDQSLANWASLLRATGREDEAARVAVREVSN
ncbi:MAG TPA: tetratricopeptide repeat protein [Thermoanaerobaculia bacterium]|jgi:tetratricopeptide (TPR) repeat protein|nr:tetratricopeptide repeat protein [Thermoanaerobaculia bacterium]